MERKVRVRFAPSPTGALHLGGVRTALFNYLFAKHHGGEFLLRIEDTDQTRYVEGAEEYIIKSLKWCGLTIDEGIGAESKTEGNYGPYRQSERKAMYKQYALQLVESGNAYYAFDTAEELSNMRTECEAVGNTFIYNATTRGKLNNSLNMRPEELASKLENGEAYVIRFKMPDNEDIQMQDIIRGDVQFNSALLDDKVLYKSDGMPTYHLANVVDDHLMLISHVIRGEEWLPSMPLHVSLYKAFGWTDTMPEFAHLPLILKPVGNGKLSKRDGNKMGFPVFPMEFTDPATGEKWHGYKEDGYFPEAFVNMLALLGWNPGTEQEIFTINELCQLFSLDRVKKAGAKFDPEKTKWFNHKYLIGKTNEELASLMEDFIKEDGLVSDPTKVAKICSLVKDRYNFVAELYQENKFFFCAPTEYNEKDTKKHWKEGTSDIIKELSETIASIEDFTAANIKEIVSTWVQSKELGFGKVMNPLRISIVGACKGPDMFDILELVGKEEVVRRLSTIISSF